MTDQWKERPLDAQLLRVEEAADLLAISRTQVYALIRSRALDSVKLGRSRRVPLSAVVTFIEGQLEASDGAGPVSQASETMPP
jgi:excisionase family DNA binding protein